jgi:HD superfamily phosphohydrolase
MNSAVSRATGKDFSIPIRDPIWKHVFLDEAFEAIVASPPFFKLSKIRQLGPAYLAYPGATHTRFAHSLGVFHLAKRMLRSLGERYELPFVTYTGARSFLVAALCHDLGHFPYAHSLKELPLKRHEALTAEILLHPPMRELAESAGADPEFAAAIADEGLVCRAADVVELAFYRSALSGVLDPDKLDYLNRDAYYCGVPYGTQDVDFAFQHLVAADAGELMIDARGAMSVEAVLFSKYLMYRSVYWNRTVRSATAMAKKSIGALLASGRLEPERLYGLDDEGFSSLVFALEDREARHARAALQGAAYPCALELPFDPERHADIEPLEGRERVEASLSKALSSSRDTAVIVDLPERISFESDVAVSTDAGSTVFSESGTVFTRVVVDGFVHSIRTLRVFVDRELATVELAAIADRFAAGNGNVKRPAGR